MINLILKFMFFGILGYVVEVFYVYIGSKKWINRGFLHGPYIPIYAFGSLFIILFLTKYSDDFVIVFLIGMFICSALEYITSHLMELIFKRRWWDYSEYKYNINGRVALKNSVLFGIGSLIIVYVLSPSLNIVLENTNNTLKLVLAVIFVIIIFIDFVFSAIDAYVTSKNIDLNQNIKIRILKAYPYLIKNNMEILTKLENLKNEIKDKTNKIKNKLK